MCFPAVESVPWRPAGWHRCLWVLGADAAKFLEHCFHFVAKMHTHTWGWFDLKEVYSEYMNAALSKKSDKLWFIDFGVQQNASKEDSGQENGEGRWRRNNLMEVWSRRWTGRYTVVQTARCIKWKRDVDVAPGHAPPHVCNYRQGISNE